ncbi:hypothetical protein C5167_018961 [Papaver somniferum]|uniref:Uncharacterized protein n=1 Tax=Papaver somniferum TaxID=3469 RepID=A0A4Y7IQX4_PAPSO|nr:hypothetical protein C5167_018961 [Papaver somniferum]
MEDRKGEEGDSDKPVMKLNFFLRIINGVHEGQKLYCDNVDCDTINWGKFKQLVKIRLRGIGVLLASNVFMGNCPYKK